MTKAFFTDRHARCSAKVHTFHYCKLHNRCSDIQSFKNSVLFITRQLQLNNQQAELVAVKNENDDDDAICFTKSSFRSQFLDIPLPYYYTKLYA